MRACARLCVLCDVFLARLGVACFPFLVKFHHFTKHVALSGPRAPDGTVHLAGVVQGDDKCYTFNHDLTLTHQEKIFPMPI